MKDLRFAMSEDETLRAMVRELVLDAPSLDAAALASRFEALLMRWAGVENVDPASRGEHIDARKLAVLETLHGREFVNWLGMRDPGADASAALEAYHDEILSSYLAKFLVQQPLAYFNLADIAQAWANPLLPMILLDYDVESDAIISSHGEFAVDFYNLLVRPSFADDSAFGRLDGLLSLLDAGLSQELYGESGAFRQALGNALSADAAASGPWQVVMQAIIAGARLHRGDETDAVIVAPSGARTDILIGGKGDDVLTGGAGDDIYVYRFGDGNDLIVENGTTADTDRLVFLDLGVEDLFFSFDYQTNDLVVRVLASGETVRVQRHFEGAMRGIEAIHFADGTVWDRVDIRGNAWLQGTSGNDTIVGSSGNDILDGGAGDDVLRGGAGSDTYIYGIGYGHDRIIENGAASDTDVVRLIGLDAGDVTFSRAGSNLVIRIDATGETLTVQEHFWGAAWGVEEIHFADGTVWDQSQIQQAAWFRGTSGNDTIVGSSGNDILDGGAGDDVLRGGAGSDTYIYGIGYGHDRIIENGAASDTDVVRLIGLDAGDVTFSRAGSNLVIRIDATGETLTVQEHFWGAAWGVEEFHFADGTVWTHHDVRAHLTLANGTVITHNGSSGDDVIVGTSGNDVIHGGAGNDVLTGGLGDDTFVFRPNFGHDTITDFTAGAGTPDRIVFDPSLFDSFASVLASAAQVEGDTLITLDQDNSLLLKNIALASLHADDFRFVA